MLMTFLQKLKAAMQQNNSLFCVGLDPDVAKLPPQLQSSPQPLLEFNKAIIDATADLVCAFKLNSAFYEALGTSGLQQLKLTTQYINKTYPAIPVILDAKRADIGNTNQGYAISTFDYLGMDAVTVHPYLGGEALQPLLDRADKGVIVLCRTSNPGAAEFQDLQADGQPVYMHVAQKVAQDWNKNQNCLLVVGATYPQEMKAIRQAVGPDIFFLVPGVGAQGGDIAAIMAAGLGPNQNELIINSSRDIIYASAGKDFAQAARVRAQATYDEINKHRS